MLDTPGDWRANRSCALLSSPPCGPALHIARNSEGCILIDGFLYGILRGMLPGVPPGHIEFTAETHAPIVKVFCVVCWSGGCCLYRRRGSSGRWWCCSICCTIAILISTWLPTLSSSTSSTSSASVGSASATSNGWYICL